jgi:hypothetical protein
MYLQNSKVHKFDAGAENAHKVHYHHPKFFFIWMASSAELEGMPAETIASIHPSIHPSIIPHSQQMSPDRVGASIGTRVPKSSNCFLGCAASVPTEAAKKEL